MCNLTQTSFWNLIYTIAYLWSKGKLGWVWHSSLLCTIVEICLPHILKTVPSQNNPLFCLHLPYKQQQEKRPFDISFERDLKTQYCSLFLLLSLVNCWLCFFFFDDFFTRFTIVSCSKDCLFSYIFAYFTIRKQFPRSGENK